MRPYISFSISKGDKLLDLNVPKQVKRTHKEFVRSVSFLLWETDQHYKKQKSNKVGALLDQDQWH